MTPYIYVENLTAINSDKRGEKIPYCGWKLYQIPWIYVDKYIHNKIWFSTKFPILNFYLSKQLVCNNCFVFDGVYLSITLPWSKIFGLYEPLCLFWDTYFLPFQSIEIRCLGFSKAGFISLRKLGVQRFEKIQQLLDICTTQKIFSEGPIINYLMQIGRFNM